MVASKIKTLIVEDELSSQQFISQILERNFSHLDVVGAAQSVKDAVALIEREQPELLLLDIELSDGTSFEIFDKVSKHDFEVIFVTAFDNYVERAMEHFALGYVVKPVDETKLVKAIQRYIDLKDRVFALNKFRALQDFMTQSNPNLLVNTGDQHVSVKIGDVIKCVADGNYTHFHMANSRPLMASNSLKYYDDLFTIKGFFRANRSTLINVKHILSIYKKETIVLSNKDKVQVSKRKRSSLNDLISSIS